MRLRPLIEGRRCAAVPPAVRAVAGVAGVAAPLPPESWAAALRATTVEAVDLIAAAGRLETLRAAGAVAEALRLGWDPRELVGLRRGAPHDHPSHAGLVFSLWPGDRIASVGAAGCVIRPAGAGPPHRWLRAPPADVVLPWEMHR